VELLPRTTMTVRERNAFWGMTPEFLEKFRPKPFRGILHPHRVFPTGTLATFIDSSGQQMGMFFECPFDRPGLWHKLRVGQLKYPWWTGECPNHKVFKQYFLQAPNILVPQKVIPNAK
jgi:hypothetical protein